MDRIRLGRTGMMVTRLGLGGIPIQRTTEEESITIVKRCLELDVKFIDTANAYTTSEERIGKGIAGRRDEVILATKSHARTREGIKNELELSLKRLNVEYIDLYQMHHISNPDGLKAALDPNGPRAFLEEAKKSGIVRHIGVSSHQMDIAKELVKSDLFETIMLPLNYITYEAADDLLELTRKHDVGFITMKPFAGGILDNATLAIKYLMQFPDILILPGIEKVREIEEIVKIYEGPKGLTPAELIEIERIRKELGSKFCHRCDYCQPCAQGIVISDVLHIHSFHKRLRKDQIYSGWVIKRMEEAMNCEKCGLCEERCPFGIPIRDMIEEYTKWYFTEKAKYDKEAIF